MSLAGYYDGPDLSRYQTSQQMLGYDLVMLNVEDPGYADKAHFAHDNGIPYDAYKWIYPTQDGSYQFDVATQIIGRANVPGRRPALWADFEQSGVYNMQITRWFAEADAQQWDAGWYEYLALIQELGNPAPGRPFWIAYYPGSNNGYYDPSYSGNARAWGALVHQYTSTNGTLDQNVVLDDNWWLGWSQALPPAPPAPPIDWNAIDQALKAQRGNNEMATVMFRDHEVTAAVDADGNLRQNSFDNIGQHVVVDEVVIATRCDPNIQPSARVAPALFPGGPDALVFLATSRDGHLMRVWWSDDGWHHTDNSLATSLPM